MPNIQSAVNQLIGFVGKMKDEFSGEQNTDNKTSSIKIENVRNKGYQNRTEKNNYKNVMQNLANKVSDRKKQQNSHKEFMNYIRPGESD